MKDDIATYQPLQPSVVAVGTHRVRAFVGDQQATLHGALWVDGRLARVVTLAGDRRVEAVLFDTDGVEVGAPVRCEDATAHWPRPVAGVTALDELQFTTAPPTRGHEQAKRPLHTRIEVLDELLPLLDGGVTLVLDASTNDALIDRLAALWDRPFVGAAARRLPHASHQVHGESGLALVVAASWAAQLGRPLHVEAAPFDLDTLLPDRRDTVLARMLLRDGFEAIAETLEVGSCDTQIVLTEDGHIDLTRSSSQHARRPAQLAALDDLFQHLQIFGPDDLTDAELEAIATAERLSAQLL